MATGAPRSTTNINPMKTVKITAKQSFVLGDKKLEAGKDYEVSELDAKRLLRRGWVAHASEAPAKGKGK